MAAIPPVIKFITYEEYLNLQERIGSDELAQFQLADSIMSIYEVMEFGSSIQKASLYSIDGIK